jgi:hypothetical protein
MYLFSVEQGFEKFRQALQQNDQPQISFWENTMKNVFKSLIINLYDKEMKDINSIYESIKFFILKYKGEDIFKQENVKKFIEFKLKEIECAENLLFFKDMVHKELGYWAC